MLLKSDVICLKIMVDSGHEIYLKKMSNKNQHSKNGNVQKSRNSNCKKLKLLHINKGNSNFKNKITDIQIIINKYNPDIFTIAEANLDKNYTDYVAQFSDYNIELNKMFKIIGISRNAILIKKQIAYKRREDLEDDETCTIWIEILIKRFKKVLLMGGYRQWTLPNSIDPQNKVNKGPKQVCRLQKKIAKWQLALEENKDVIVLIDDNIDSDINSSHNKQYKIKNLYDLWQQHMTDYNIYQHNNQYTRFHRAQQPSTIDHIFSNCPPRLSYTSTIRTHISDHAMLMTNYISSDIIYKPKFIKIRKNKLLSKRHIKNQFDNNATINDIFNYTDPDIIADIIQIEMNSMIELIAPQSYIQYTKDYAPYLTDELRSEIKTTDDLLTIAIETKNPTAWIEFKNSRNVIQKKLKIKKKKKIWKNNFHAIKINGN